MKKLISSILTIVVILTCFSVTAFAADTNLYFNDGATTITADADTIDLTLYLTKDDEDILAYGYDMIQLNYTISGATMAGTALKSSTDFDDSNSVSSTTLLFTAKSALYIPTQATDALATFSLTRDGDAKSATITFTNVMLQDTVTPFEYKCTYPTTVTINWPGEEEEEFEATYEGVKAADGSVTEGFASGSKVATVFAKAETALTAGTYGIVFGGQKYVGAGDVAEGKYWVIRLYDPSGNILTGGSYTCQKFVGEAVEAVDYKLETK